jgi:hypothetical protein
LQTLDSGAFDLLHPTPEMVSFSQMATVLAKVPRFGAHTTDDEIYSVAQHSTEGAKAIMRDTGRSDAALAFLLHDGHEYIMGDIATPIADALAALASIHGGVGGAAAVRVAILNLKRRLDRVIYAAAGLPWPAPLDVSRLVKDYDVRMCQTERLARLAPSPHGWGAVYENAAVVEGCDLFPRSTEAAMSEFLSLFREWC